jgi:hypothetical protein
LARLLQPQSGERDELRDPAGITTIVVVIIDTTIHPLIITGMVDIIHQQQQRR